MALKDYPSFGSEQAPGLSKESSNYSNPITTGYSGYNQQPFQQSLGDYQTASSMARSVASPESRDRAAARLRARVDTQYNAADEQLRDRQAGYGTLNSGRANYDLMRNMAGRFGATASGMADLESQYDDLLLKSAESLNSSGDGLSTLGDRWGTLGLKEATDLGALGVSQQNADTSMWNSSIDSYNANTDRKNTEANASHMQNDDTIRMLVSILQSGNVLRDPGGALGSFFQSMGIDPAMLSFYSPTATTISTPGGTPGAPGGAGGGGGVDWENR